MANFCTYCGKQLQDGEVCNCKQQANTQQAPQQNVQYQQAPQQNMQYQQAPQQNMQYQQQAPQQNMQYQQAPQQNGQPQPLYQQVVVKPVGPNPIAEGFKQISKFLKDMINKPVEAVKDFMNAEDARGPLVFLAIQTIVYILYHVVMMAVCGLREANSIDISSLYDLMDYEDPTKAGAMDYVQSILFPIIWTAVIIAILIGLIMALSNALEKKTISVKKALSFCAVPNAGIIVIVFVSLIIGAIDNSNVSAFTSFINVGIGTFVLFQIYFALSEIFSSVKNKIYAAVTCAAVLCLASEIMNIIFDKFTNFYPLPF